MQRFCPNGKGKKILTVGRLVQRKGHAFVIRALSTVKKVIPNIRYIIVGKGPEEFNLRNLVNKLGLSDTVVFVGEVAQEDLPGYYWGCDLFVMPSYEPTPGDYEGFGIVFLEAAACRKPVIAGITGGQPEAVVDGETGLLVDPLDTLALPNVLIRLLTDETLAKRLGENGRRRVEREFTWEKMGEKLKGYLREIIR